MSSRRATCWPLSSSGAAHGHQGRRVPHAADPSRSRTVGPVREIALYDVDRRRLAVIGGVLDTQPVPGLTGAPLPDTELALARAVKAAERGTITASLTGSLRAAEDAFAAHPLVGSRSVARSLMAAHRAQHVELSALS